MTLRLVIKADHEEGFLGSYRMLGEEIPEFDKYWNDKQYIIPYKIAKVAGYVS